MDEWKLVVGILIVITTLVMMFVFFYGSSYDYKLPGQENSTGLCDIVPQWMCPPPRYIILNYGLFIN